MIKSRAVFIKNFIDAAAPARILLCLAVLLAYASVWPNGFVFDDEPQITGNALLQHWSSLPQLLAGVKHDGALIAGFCRPVQLLIYFLIYQVFGLSTVAFHALNLSLHALNACLLHHFGVRAGFRKGAAFAAALLWAVHPLQVIDIAYISSTAEPLHVCFCLLGLIALLPDFTPRKIGKALVFFVLALGAKESAVVFPALAAVTFFCVSRERTQVAAYVRMWPLWLLTAGYIAVWLLLIRLSGYTMDKSPDPQWVQLYTANFIDRVLTSLATLPVYAGLIVWPTGLHIERVFPSYLTLLLWPPAIGALIVMAGLLQIIWGRAKRGLALSFGLLWFAVALSPYTGIVLPIDAIISEGWMYMPMMGLFLGVAQTVAGFFEKRQTAARLLVAVLALVLGSATFVQNGVWRNPETLYQNIVQNDGDGERLSPSLGVFYMKQGEFDKAIEQLQFTVDHPAGRTKDLQAEVHLQMAMAWLHVSPDENGKTFTLDVHALPSYEHVPEAIGELGRALQDNPDFIWAHAALAALYRYQGDTQMAGFHLKQVEAILKKQGKTGQ